MTLPTTFVWLLCSESVNKELVNSSESNEDLVRVDCIPINDP